MLYSDVAWPKHQKMCTAEKPFRAAGTGLGKESLSTKLVPGKIAGSMHSNLPAREAAITAASQALDLPSMSSLDINKQVGHLKQQPVPNNYPPPPCCASWPLSVAKHIASPCGNA